jgi:molybdate transport system substrate-binding protein
MFTRSVGRAKSRSDVPARTNCQRARFALLALFWVMMMTSPTHASEVLLHAAGSLRDALTDVAKAFETSSGETVRQKYGASGTLRGTIASGERAEVFASANMAHPQSLAQAGKAGPVVRFARNRLCALVKPGLAVTPDNLLERMLSADIKLGTSTPKADPSGDYAFEVFGKAEAIKPGSRAALEQKARQLTGGATSAQPPDGRSVYGWHIAQGSADIFLAYCTAAAVAVKENPGQQIVALPEALAVGADYGLTVMNEAAPAAYRFAMFILSTEGQGILAKHGFAAPGL